VANTVENGTVTGFHDGIVLLDDSVVKSVHAYSNAHDGITTGNNSVIEGCTAISNANNGIVTGNNSVVSRCTANSSQAGTGIQSGNFGVVEGSTASFNGFFGISCHQGCAISGNATSNNHTTGIVVDLSGLILHNTSISNSFGGISATGATTGYGENVLDGNSTNVGGGTSMKNNVCSGVLC
jgi:hypothetical protein